MNVVAPGRAFGKAGLLCPGLPPHLLVLRGLCDLLSGSFGALHGVAAEVREESSSVNP